MTPRKATHRIPMAAAGVMTVLLTACSGSSAMDGVDSSGSVSSSVIGDHLHTLAYDGPTLLMGAHNGLWAQAPGAQPSRVSAEAFDVMGFAVGDDSWYASGHPGPGMDAPDHLGLLASTDSGRTWTEVALAGDVDFHRLATSGEVIVGLNSMDSGLIRSDDAGATWTTLTNPGLYDVVIDPADPDVLVGTTEQGPVRSTDGGATFTTIARAPLLALLAWTGPDLYGVGVDGRVHHSGDGGLTWTARGSMPGQPMAVTAQGQTIAGLVDTVIVESADGGSTFTARLTDAG